MKTIYLVRHAKAVKDAETPDSERPLDERGRQEARDAAVRARSIAAPEVLISSPALRAFQTAELFAEELGISVDRIMKRKALYDQRRNAYRGVIREIGEGIGRIMIVGHNPSITEFARWLDPGFEGDIPTAGVVGLEVDADSWKDFGEGRGRVLFIEVPARIGHSELRKRRRRDLEEKISAAVRGVLEEEDRSAAESMREDFLRVGHKLAGKFVKRSEARRRAAAKEGMESAVEK